MHLHPRPSPRTRWAVASALALALVPAAPALADEPAADPVVDAAPASVFSTALTPAVTEIQTGEKVDVELAYSCSGAAPCTDVVVVLPRPAGLPDLTEYVSTWQSPVLTSSSDVSDASAGPDGSVRFTMNESVPAGTSGTLGIRYSTLGLLTPTGTSLEVTATSTGSNVETASSQTSVLQTASPAALIGRNDAPYPAYTDRDLTFALWVRHDSTEMIGVEGMSTLTADLVLPEGAVFVSADVEPTSVSADGRELHWDDVPGQDTSAGSAQSRWMRYVVRFPAEHFSDGARTEITGTVGGTTVSGAPSAPVPATSSFTLKEHVAVFKPYVQLHSQQRSEGGSFSTGTVTSRGQEVGIAWYLNNYNSTVPATGVTSTLTVPEELTPTRFGRSGDGATPLVVRWTTESGATGEFTTDFPEAADGSTPSLVELGVPEGDRVTGFEIVHGGAPATGGHTSPTLYGIMDAPAGTRVDLRTSVVVSADGYADETRTAEARFAMVDPHPVPFVSIQHDAAGTAVRPGQPLDWTVGISSDSIGMHDLEPVLYLPVPDGTRLTDDPVTVGTSWSPAPVELQDPEVSVVHNEALDQDVLVVRWPGATMTGLSYLPLTVHTVVTSAPPGTVDVRAFVGDARGPISEAAYSTDPYNPLVDDTAADQWTNRVRDTRDLDGDGVPGGALGTGRGSAATGTGAGLRSQLEVQGSLDDDLVAPPLSGATESGAAITYRLPIENTGNVPLTDIVIYDVLPAVGDTGVSEQTASVSRGSTFTPRLDSPVVAPEGFEVWYSTSTNPCRPEVYPSLTGCDDTWTLTPDSLSQVRSIKLVQVDGSALEGGATTSATWTMSVSQEVPGGALAVNSAAFSATRTDSGQKIVAEPAFVTVEVAQADLSVSVADATWAASTPQPAGVEVANAGPSDAPAHVEVVLPDGVTATVVETRSGSAAWSCTVEGSQVGCDVSGLVESGTSGELPIVLEADESLAGTTVELAATVTGRYPDVTPADNTDEGEIVILDEDVPPVEPTPEPTVDPTTDPTVDPTTDPSTDPGTDPSTVPSTDPSTAPSAGPTAGPTSTTTDGSAADGASGGGASLATTGASVAGAVLLAAGLVLGGLALRRRHRAG